MVRGERQRGAVGQLHPHVPLPSPVCQGHAWGSPWDPGRAWGSTQHLATSICLSVPLQPEPKEERHKAAAGGEPFSGDPCPILLRCLVFGTPGWAAKSTVVLQPHMCPPAAYVLTPGWAPRGDAAREVPRAHAAVGGDPSLLGPLPQQAIR